MTPDERKNLAEQITTNPLFIAVFDEMEQAAIERLIYETEFRHEAQLRVIAIRTLRATFADLWDITKDAEGKVIDKKVKGAKKAKANKAEAAWEYKGCEVIDMDTVATPQRVWL